MYVRRNIIANYFGRAYSIAAVYLFLPFYVKILGVEAFGVIAVYTTLLTLSGLADVGLSATFAREAARSKNKKKLLDLMSTIERVLYLSVGLIALIIFASAEAITTRWLNIGGQIDEQTIIWSFRLMALMIIPQLGISLYSAGLIGLQKQVKANVVQSLFITARSGLVVLVILWRPELHLFFIWQLVATFAFALVIRIVLVKELGFPAWRLGVFDYNGLKANMVFAGGMLWISIISSINTQIDKLLVSKLFSLTDFGYYTLAGSLAQVPVALATPIAVAFYPLVTAHVANRDKGKERLAFETYGQWIAFTGALGAFGVALFAPQLLALWLQEPALPPVVAKISSMLAIGSLFLSLATPAYYLGLAHGQSGLIAILVTGTALLSVPLMILTVQTFGLLGATFPWLVLNLINFLVVTTLVVGRHLGRRYLGQVARILGLPVVFVLLPLMGARHIANTFQAPPAVACCLAVGGALCAVLAFLALRRTETSTRKPLRFGE